MQVKHNSHHQYSYFWLRQIKTEFLPKLLGDIDMVHLLDDLNVFSRAHEHTALPAAQADFGWRFLHHSLLLFLLYLDLLLHYGLDLKLSDLHKTKKMFLLWGEVRCSIFSTVIEVDSHFLLIVCSIHLAHFGDGFAHHFLPVFVNALSLCHPRPCLRHQRVTTVLRSSSSTGLRRGKDGTSYNFIRRMLITDTLAWEKQAWHQQCSIRKSLITSFVTL